MSLLIPFLALAVILLKAGFLVWVFVRTRKPAAIAYVIYIALSSTVGGVPYMILERVFSPSSGTEGESLAFALFMVRVAGALLETLLFIWLVRSVMKRIQLQPNSTDAL